MIVGAGSAGIMVANRLQETDQAAGRCDYGHRKERETLLSARLPDTLFDIDKEEDLSRDVKGLLVSGITLVTDEARKINPHGTVTTARSGNIPFDYVIVATGAKLVLDEPEGLKEGLKIRENRLQFLHVGSCTEAP